MQGCQHGMIHLVELGFLFLSSLMTVVGLTCKTRGVTNPAGIHGPINNLIFDVLRLAGIGIVKEKRAPLARGLSAAIALLTLWSSPMSHDIRALAMWAMQDLGDHTSSLSWR